MAYWGGIEGGGTKFVCAIGDDTGTILERTQFPTTSPEETLGRTISFFKEQQAHYDLKAIGIGTFGPVDLHPASPTFGYITTTPKPGWRHVDVVGAVRQVADLPIGFDTDVNGAALAEVRWGAGQGLDTLIYLTVGTGIGGGVYRDGALQHGLVHPEIGHLFIPQHPEDLFEGNCPFHNNNCLEGLASGPAIQKRWRIPGQELKFDHPAWHLEAYYLALACINLIVTYSPERIILGGGIMHQEQLFPLIHKNVDALLNGYIKHPAILEGLDTYIQPPGLGDDSGVCGAIALAQMAYRSAEKGSTA